jgi:hypothetical protein
VFICSACQRDDAACRCPPPKRRWIPSNRKNLLLIAEMVLLRRERHALTAEDLVLLKEARIAWE